jgi:hypothetical protein
MCCPFTLCIADDVSHLLPVLWAHRWERLLVFCHRTASLKFCKYLLSQSKFYLPREHQIIKYIGMHKSNKMFIILSNVLNWVNSACCVLKKSLNALSSFPFITYCRVVYFIRHRKSDDIAVHLHWSRSHRCH